jgi:trehalose 6-phosphate synthase/phosphatase
VADALEEALAMDSDDRRDRMERMREKVLELDCRRWAHRFLEAVDAVGQAERDSHAPQRLGHDDELAIIARARAAEHRVLLLDYDGTLRELTGRPLDARPTGELRALLQRLARLPATEVHVVSGRDRRTLAAWLGDLPTALCAEHGFAWRSSADVPWTTRDHVELGWLPRVEALLRRIEAEVDGSEVERKPCALAWHYRMVDADYGEWRARELRLHLEEQLAGEPVEILLGRKVVEVRAAGVNKGRYVEGLELGERTFVLAMGDDRTDIDVYRALPPGSTSIHVGAGGDLNLYRIESPSKVRAFLGRFADALEK